MSIKPRQQKNGKTVFDVRIQYGGIRVSRTVPTTITKAERVESKILDAAPQYFQRIVFFACNTGMRKMEILDLQFKQNLSKKPAKIVDMRQYSGNADNI